MKKNKLAVLLIIILSVIIFANTIRNEFVWDDKAFIVEDSDIKDLSNAGNFFTKDYQGLYRPLRTLSYAISYQLWGEFPFYYHIQAMLIHIICSILVYYIFLNILKKWRLSLFGALLFAAHPIHTEAISFITASFDQIAIIFLLSSFLLYIKKKNKSSIFFYLLAALSSEIAIVLPFLIILYDFTFRLKPTKKNFKKQVKKYLPYIIIFVVFLLIRFFLIKVIGRVDLDGLGWGYGLRVLSMPKIIFKYVLLMLWPLNLSVKHYIPISGSIFDFSLLIPIVLLLTLVFLSIKLYKNHKIIFFSIWFFFISLLPVSNIIPIQRLMTEAYLYLASIGFVLLLGFLISKIPSLDKKNKNLKIISLAVFIVIIIAYSFIVIDRNKDWKDEQTLWERTVEVNPNSATAYNNLGFIYQEKGEYNKAGESFLRSIELNPNRALTHYNIGVLYGKLNAVNQSIQAYEKAVELDPMLLGAHINLGIMYDNTGRFEEAYDEYVKALDIDSGFEVYVNLGNHFDRLKEYDKAIENYEKAIEINTYDAVVHYNLGVVYLKRNEFDKAKDEFFIALQINPKFYLAEEKILQLEDKGLI